MAVLVGEEQIIEVESSTIIIAMAIIIDLVWVIMPILDYYCIAFDSSTYSNSCYQAWNFICSLLNFFWTFSSCCCFFLALDESYYPCCCTIGCYVHILAAWNYAFSSTASSSFTSLLVKVLGKPIGYRSLSCPSYLGIGMGYWRAGSSWSCAVLECICFFASRRIACGRGKAAGCKDKPHLQFRSPSLFQESFPP